MRQISNSKGRFLTIYGNSDEEGSTTDKICRKREMYHVSCKKGFTYSVYVFLYRSPVLLPTHSCFLLEQ